MRSRVRFSACYRCQIGECRRRLATDETSFRSCVAQTPRRGDGSRHSLHASEEYPEYNEALFHFLFRMLFFADLILKLAADLFLKDTISRFTRRLGTKALLLSGPDNLVSNWYLFTADYSISSAFFNTKYVERRVRSSHVRIKQSW